jgi:hypothetical protein
VREVALSVVVRDEPVVGLDQPAQLSALWKCQSAILFWMLKNIRTEYTRK